MLPGLEPHHTRQSFCSGTRLYIEKVVQSPDDFLLNPDNGLWLLPTSVAERDRDAAIEKLNGLSIHQLDEGLTEEGDRNGLACQVMRDTVINELGCMTGGLDSDEQAFSLPGLVLLLAAAEWGGPSLDEEDDLEYLRACPTDGCYNTRHYDLDFSRHSVQARMTELNPHWYEVSDDGEVRTIWGDELPTVLESMQLFMEMQRANYPYVGFDESTLTPSGVAQVRFHPLTGCWESWLYNIKPDGSRGGRFEGYGQLYFRYRKESIDEQTGEVIGEKRRGHWLTHRLMWSVMGKEVDSSKVLNHLCNYKRCCNPGHLEQITEYENRLHGVNARKYIGAIEQDDPGVRNAFMSAEEIYPLQQDARRLYQKLSQQR